LKIHPLFSCLPSEDDWNNCGYRYGQFMFFGDKELLDEIARRLGSATSEIARDTPALRPVSCSE
jgi:hypothetical protein